MSDFLYVRLGKRGSGNEYFAWGLMSAIFAASGNHILLLITGRDDYSNHCPATSWSLSKTIRIPASPFEYLAL